MTSDEETDMSFDYKCETKN